MPFYNSGRDLVEVCIMANQDRPCFFRSDCYERVSGIGWYQSTAKFAGVAFFHQHFGHRFCYILIKKKVHLSLRTSHAA